MAGEFTRGGALGQEAERRRCSRCERRRAEGKWDGVCVREAARKVWRGCSLGVVREGGVTGGAEEARPAGESPAAYGASSMHGRRGVGRDDWRGGSRGVTARGNEASRARIGEENGRELRRTPGGFQTGAGLGSTRQSITALGGVTFFIGSKLQKVELCTKMCKHQTFRGKSVLQLSCLDFGLDHHGF